MAKHRAGRPDPMAWSAPAAPRAPQATYQRLLDWAPVLTRGAEGVVVAGRHEVDEVRAVRALVHGFLTLEQVGGFGLPDDVGASFDRAVDALVAGLTRT